MEQRKNKRVGVGAGEKGRLLEDVAEISHNPPGWGEKGPRVWENKGAGARGPYANDRAVEAVTWKALGREVQRSSVGDSRQEHGGKVMWGSRQQSHGSREDRGTTWLGDRPVGDY